LRQFRRQPENATANDAVDNQSGHRPTTDGRMKGTLHPLRVGTV
jgi:hypothetical protein